MVYVQDLQEVIMLTVKEGEVLKPKDVGCTTQVERHRKAAQKDGSLT